MSKNPFRPAEQVAPKIKAFVFGASGVGKTYLALTSPGRIAAIDTEGGMAFYAKRAGKGQLSEFDVLPTKTFRDLQAGVAYIRENPTAYSTLVIDPITVVYETLQDAAQIKRAGKRNDPDADLEMLDWQRIKRSYKSLMTELVNLPVHVIVIARERDDTERRGDQSIKVGVKADTEKGTAYFFDTVIHLTATKDGREAVVLKDRTGVHQLNARIANPTFDALFGGAIAAGHGDTADRNVQDDSEAAQIDADADEDPWKGASEDGGLIGTAEIGKPGSGAEFELRQTPDGYALGFRLVSGRGGIKVLAGPTLAPELAGNRDRIIGQRVTCWGRVAEETFRATGSQKTITYQVLTLERIRIPGVGDLPLPEPTEAPSAGMFDAETESDLDRAAVA